MIKKIFFAYFIFIVGILSSEALGETRVLYEDWETGIIDSAVWTAYGAPAAKLETQLGYESNWGLNPNGDDWCGSGVVSKKTFDLNRGLRLRWKMRNVFSDIYEFFQNIDVGITTDVLATGDCDEGGYQYFTSIGIGAAKVNPQLYMSVIGQGNDISEESKQMPFPGTIWIQCEIIVHKDGHISFWLDDNLVLVTSHQRELSGFTSSRVQISGRCAFAVYPDKPVEDNLEVFLDVDTPSPDPPPVCQPYEEAPKVQKEISAYMNDYRIPAFIGGGNAASTFLTDIDGDEDLDLFIARENEELLLFINIGSKFSPNWSIEATGFIAGGEKIVNSPCFADIDGDGDMDGFFVVSGKVNFYRNTGTIAMPRFELETENYITPTVDASPINVRLADLDADGDLDLVIALADCRTGNTKPRIEIFRNMGSSTQPDFQILSVISDGLWDGDGASVDLMDVDEDGDYDFILGYSIVADKLFLLINEGTPEEMSSFTGKWWIPSSGMKLPQINHGDLNNDGRMELLIGDISGRIAFYQQIDPYGLFDWNQLSFSYIAFDIGDESAPSVGDTDNDNDMDMVIGNFDGQLVFLKNDGSRLEPKWASPAVLPIDLPEDIYAIVPALADLDNDGDLDILIGDLNGGLTACWNDGSKEEPLWGRLTLNFGDIHVGSRSAPALRDLDSDGLLDLVIGNGQGQIKHYEQHGGTDFTQYDLKNEHFADSDVGFAARPVIADVDEDGDPDILVGNMDGCMMFFRNDGTKQAPAYTKAADNYFSCDETCLLSPLAVDIDGDGDKDFFLRGIIGGILCFIQNTEKLNIQPSSITITTRHTMQFKITDLLPSSDVAAVFQLNKSGGSLILSGGDTITYTSGLTGGPNIYDIIMVEDKFNGLSAKATINILRDKDAEAVGKAIIVAGKRPGTDPLSDVTIKCANYAYNALRFQGYTKENIKYLSFQTDIDVDNNGKIDDVDAETTMENLTNTMEVWAGDEKNLLMYIVDHGGENKFQLNPTTVLKEKTLKGWIENALANNTEKVILVYDACKSGSFISSYMVPDGKTFVMLTSSNESETAKFLEKGVLSFSYQFWASIFGNSNLYDAFISGKKMMDSYQQPLIDADGDGVYNEKNDGKIVSNINIGKGVITADSPPYIQTVSANQILHGELSASFLVSDIVALNNITRVWAVIYAPDHDAISLETPILDLPTIELKENENGFYLGNYNNFTQNGTYRICIYAMDSEGLYAEPKVISVTQAQKAGSITGNINTNIVGYSAPIAEAKVSLIETGQSVFSDIEGNYIFSGVLAGTYTIKWEKEGFEPVTVAGVVVHEEQNTPVFPVEMEFFKQSGVPCDFDGDGKIGLEEAIRALQVLSGIK